MSIKSLYNHFEKHPQITTDSRNCPVGSIYFALKGERFDGNKFALSALEKGCSLAVVDDISLKDAKDCFFVDDVLTTLQELATYHRKKIGIKIIGITGTNGKTTTKELIATVLSKKYKVGFTQGNLNNHIGVPLTLLSFSSDTEIAVVEMGANHIKEIEFLTNIAQPDYGLITNVGKAHLEGFGSFEGVMKAKAELYDYLKQNKKTVFINQDNQLLSDMLGDSSNEKIGYGTNKNSYISGELVKTNSFLEFYWNKNSEKSHVTTQLLGQYNFENALAAVAIGNYFDVEASLINEALSNYQPQNHRSQLVETTKNKVLLDAYNANPTSVKAALDNFKNVVAKNKTVILGEMRELGDDSEREHIEVIKQLQSLSLNKIFLVGNEYKNLLPNDTVFQWFESVENLKVHLKDNGLQYCYILVKGSRSNRLEEVVECL